MTVPFDDYADARLISRVLILYYIEEKSQTEIGQMLGLSTTKVNRLLKQARAQGMVEITIRTPFQHLFELEKEFEKVTGIKQVVIIPSLSENDSTAIQAVGQAAADYLLEHIREGDTICMGGGNALFSTVQSITNEYTYDVLIVPAIGGVQGRHSTDVNNLVADLAKKLGGRSLYLHAPAFTDSAQEKQNLMGVRQIKDVIEIAREAQVAMVGIGTIRPETASYFRFTTLPIEEIRAIMDNPHAAGEVLAHLIDSEGKICLQAYEDRVVGITLEDLKSIPLTIGVAALEEKVEPIVAALRGGILKVLITDEMTARSVLEHYRSNNINISRR